MYTVIVPNRRGSFKDVLARLLSATRRLRYHVRANTVISAAWSISAQASLCSKPPNRKLAQFAYMARKRRRIDQDNLLDCRPPFSDFSCPAKIFAVTSLHAFGFDLPAITNQDDAEGMLGSQSFHQIIGRKTTIVASFLAD
jgi:hypothetical protein